MKQEATLYSVYVGAMEGNSIVNDEYLTLEDAKKLARHYRERGYDDVEIIQTFFNPCI